MKNTRIPQVDLRGFDLARVIALIATLVVGVVLAVVWLLQEKSVDFQTLKGRWLRPDGGYVLEIRAVD
jgi:hypothetical protein